MPDPGTGGSAAEELVVCPGRAAGADQMVMQSLAPFSSGCNRLILAGSARAALCASSRIRRHLPNLCIIAVLIFLSIGMTRAYSGLPLLNSSDWGDQ